MKDEHFVSEKIDKLLDEVGKLVRVRAGIYPHQFTTREKYATTMVEGLNAEEFEAAIETVKGYGTNDTLDVESAALYVNGVRVQKVKVKDTWDGGENLVCLATADDEETADYEIDGEYFIELDPCVEQLNTICEQINYWY